ncbi:MAG: LPS-assembly protein [Lentisphaeria bacterium]|jgi:LPS-assembly protein
MPKSFALLNRLSVDKRGDKSKFGKTTKSVSLSRFITIASLLTCHAVFAHTQTKSTSLASEQQPSKTHTLSTTELRAYAQTAPFGWVAKELLPHELQEKVALGCGGAYVDSLTDVDTGPQNSAQMAEQPLVIEARSATVTNGNRAVLEGGVKLSQGDRSISAGKMSYDRANDQASLEGNVSIRQTGMLIQGEHAEVSTNQHKASFSDAAFVFQESHIRGNAKSVRQTSASKLELNEGKITSCEPGSESWVLEGEKITVDRVTNQGTGRNVKLKVGSVPVFYLPYITFPVGDQRQSGLLFPSISSSDDGGVDFATPYYWNLAPNYDATITPRLISGRGAMLELETRYLNQWMRNDIGLAFLPNDGGSQDKDLDQLIEEGQITEEIARPHKGNNRWLAQLKQRSGEVNGWYSIADYTRVSDEDYFRDLGTSSLSVASTTFLNQSLEVGYQFEHWEISTLTQAQQVMLLDLDTPYRKLPQIDANGLYRLDNWNIAINNRITQFTHPDSDIDHIAGKRVNTDYRAGWEKRLNWGFIKPEIGYKSLHYQLDKSSITNIDDAEFGIGTGQASIDMGLIFEHPQGKYLQTLEPRVFYLYREFTDHSKVFGLGADGEQNINFDTSARTFTYSQLYRDSRFIGGDRLDDANQMTLGLTSRWESNTTGEELFTVSAGQIFHFKDRMVDLTSDAFSTQTTTSSEFAAELSVNIGAQTVFYSNTVYDTDSSRINRGSAGLNFASSDYNRLLNLSYSFLRDPNATRLTNKEIDQVDLSFVTPVTAQWSLMGHVNYDIQNHQELETFAGFEYNDCCYRLRFLARRWLDSNIASLGAGDDAQYDQGMFFEIHFKGLGGSGAKVNNILEDGIIGYQRREEFRK